MNINIIVAHGLNRCIGINGQLPWDIPEDLAFFKKVTMGHAVIMGRKTYNSIGKPLKGRDNLVLTIRGMPEAKNLHQCYSFNSAIELARKLGNTEAFIIGGEQIFRLSKKLNTSIDKFYITEVEKLVENGTSFFPEFDLTKYDIDRVPGTTRLDNNLKTRFAHKIYTKT